MQGPCLPSSMSELLPTTWEQEAGQEMEEADQEIEGAYQEMEEADQEMEEADQLKEAKQEK